MGIGGMSWDASLNIEIFFGLHKPKSGDISRKLGKLTTGVLLFLTHMDLSENVGLIFPLGLGVFPTFSDTPKNLWI